MQQRSGGYLQNIKLIHAKLKKERIAHVQLRQAMIYTVAHLVIQIQAMIYNAARVRSFSTKLQVDTCKSKEDRSAHAKLHTL